MIPVFKLTSLLAKGGGGVPGFKPDAFIRDFPEWMFGVFLIGLILVVAKLTFGVGPLTVIADFIDFLQDNTEHTRTLQKENLVEIYNTLNRGVYLLENGQSLHTEEFRRAGVLLTRDDFLKRPLGSKRGKVVECVVSLLESSKKPPSPREARQMIAKLKDCARMVDERIRKIRID